MHNYSFMNPVKDIDTSFYMVNEEDNINDFDASKIYRSKAFTEAMERFDKEDLMTR